MGDGVTQHTMASDTSTAISIAAITGAMRPSRAYPLRWS